MRAPSPRLGAERHEVVARGTCRDCSTTFAVTRGKAEFFTGRDLSLPQRCQPCRVLRRKRVEEDRRAMETAAAMGQR